MSTSAKGPRPPQTQERSALSQSSDGSEIDGPWETVLAQRDASGDRDAPVKGAGEEFERSRLMRCRWENAAFLNMYLVGDWKCT